MITVKMEAAAVEGGMGDEIEHVPAKSLDHVGLTGPDTIPCVAVRWQVAQKLHACTEVFDDRENDRFRDLTGCGRSPISNRRSVSGCVVLSQLFASLVDDAVIVLGSLQVGASQPVAVLGPGPYASCASRAAMRMRL